LRRRVLRQAITLLAGGPASGPVALDARHIALVAALAATQAATQASGSAVDLPGGLVATADPERVLIRRRTPGDARARHAAAESLRPEPVALPVPGTVVVPGTRWRIRATLLDAASGALPPGMEAALHGAAPTASEQSGSASAPAPAAGTADAAGRTPARAYLDASVAGDTLYVRTWQPGDRFRPLGMAGERKLQDYFVDAKVPRDERKRIPLVWGPRHLLWIAGHRIDDRAQLTAATHRVLALRLEPVDAAPDDQMDETDEMDGSEDGAWEAGPAASFDVTPDYAGFADPSTPDASGVAGGATDGDPGGALGDAGPRDTAPGGDRDRGASATPYDADIDRGDA
jgi:tRNA(Ile)-lysidine synthase